MATKNVKLTDDDLWLAAMVIAEYSDLIKKSPMPQPAQADTILRLDLLADKLFQLRFQPCGG